MTVREPLKSRAGRTHAENAGGQFGTRSLATLPAAWYCCVQLRTKETSLCRNALSEGRVGHGFFLAPTYMESMSEQAQELHTDRCAIPKGDRIRLTMLFGARCKFKWDVRDLFPDEANP